MVTVEAVGRNLLESLAVVGATQSGLVPDPWPYRRPWRAGDNGRFRALGVPILYLFNGQHFPAEGAAP
jgi:hypothetical protein